jgi:ribosomal protein S3
MVIKQQLTTVLQTISPILVYTAQEVWQLSPPYDSKPLTVYQLKWDSKLPEFSEEESIINQILDICVEVQETKGHVVINTERPQLVHQVIEHIEVLLDRHVKVNAKVG